MKDFLKNFKKVKELMKNRRYRAMIVLSMYIIFIASILMVIKINGNLKTVSVSPLLEDYSNYQNYNFSYEISSIKEGVSETINMTGKRFLDKEELSYLENNYSYENVLIGFPFTDFDITKLKSNNIASLLKGGQLVYSEGTINRYSVPLTNIVKLFNGTTISTDKQVDITVVYENSKVLQVELNLIEYINYSSRLYDHYTVMINYANIDKVVAF